MEARALANADSKSVAKFLLEDVLSRFGWFSKLVVDGGPENKKLVADLAFDYRIKRCQVSAYHPQANGMVERGHKPIVDALAKLTEGGYGKWTRNLHMVLWADRCTIRRSTGQPPYRLIFGSDPILPIELSVPTWKILLWSSVRTTADLLAIRARQLQRRDEDLDELRLHLRRQREHNKDYFDDTKHIREGPIKVGDLVLLFNSKIEKSFSDKLTYRWLGPFTVDVADIVRGTYQLAELNGNRMDHTVPGNRLKLFVERSYHTPNTNPDNASSSVSFPAPSLIPIGEDDQFSESAYAEDIEAEQPRQSQIEEGVGNDEGFSFPVDYTRRRMVAVEIPAPDTGQRSRARQLVSVQIPGS